MNILVTGSEGYIGTILVDYLMKAGHIVVGLDTGFYRDGHLFSGPKPASRTIRKDIRNVTADDVTGFDAIVHLAELSNDPLGQNNPELTYDINHNGTVHLATLAKAAGVPRFVYFSSCSVYGASDEIRDETSPVNPITAYAKSKVLNEEALQQMADSTFSPTLMRNATVYGPSPRMRFDIAVNNLTGVAWTSKTIAMDSDGTPWRPFVHVQDVCQAVACILKADRDTVHNQIINIGSSRSNYQIKEIAQEIAKQLPDCVITFNKDGADKRNYRVNFDKIQQLLPDFSCAYTVADGVAQLLAIFKATGFTADVFQAKEYTRLKQIKYLRDSNQINEQLYWTT